MRKTGFMANEWRCSVSGCFRSFAVSAKDDLINFGAEMLRKIMNKTKSLLQI